jgi:YesN/AraC family two-component response regulator
VRKARELCGSTVQRLHEGMKLAWAKELLTATSLPIHEVAGHVGYTDALYFSRVFRKREGKSPRKWRGQSMARQRRTAASPRRQ